MSQITPCRCGGFDGSAHRRGSKFCAYWLLARYSRMSFSRKGGARGLRRGDGIWEIIPPPEARA